MYNYYTVLVAVKEYERVEGWEGSDAVSPPRDGAAWTLKNAYYFRTLRGAENTAKVSLLILLIIGSK